MADPLIKAYQDRWAAVEEFERAELRLTSMELRWRQLNWIAGLARRMDLVDPDREHEAEIARARWNALREKYDSTRSG